MPPASQVHGAKPAARTGQSEAALHARVQLPTSTWVGSMSSQAAAAMHAVVVDASQAASASTQTRTGGVPTPAHP